jgi:hypothetical protein
MFSITDGIKRSNLVSFGFLEHYPSPNIPKIFVLFRILFDGQTPRIQHDILSSEFFKNNESSVVKQFNPLIAK